MNDVTNSAPERSSIVYHIIPTTGECSVMLHGWLMSYAEFVVPERDKPSLFLEEERYQHVRQEIFLSNDGHYLAVETIISGDATCYDRHCACWQYSEKGEVKPPFRYRAHLTALLKQAEIEHIHVIGQEEQ
ncbi:MULTISPECIES: hypothetical protein [Vibrio]|uniref:Uncharacterized protein n=1 Tax=Vibrio splendidus TaxID=29497 RepID=A0A2N7JPV7_VIBSP|nr:hypothetical protein [Vibrio splendidus]PMM50133.1 hypothetical protein BCT54_24550 [Vibrio splendidus]